LSNVRCSGESWFSVGTVMRGGGGVLADFLAGIGLPLCGGSFRQNSYTYTLFAVMPSTKE
jgi:hypothetical protein